MRQVLKALARNVVFANILLALFFVTGGLAVMNMVRETFPEVSLDMVFVTVVWPGADPEDVEEGISRKIEEAIEGIDGIKQYNTTSRENVGMSTIEVLEDYDLGRVKEKVRNAVEAISTFPPDAEKPVIEELLIRDEVLIVSLSGEGMTERGLKEWAEAVKEEIRSLPEVSQVEVIGARDYEIGIELSEEKLREYGLDFSQVAGLVRASSINLSGGTMRTQGEEIRLRTLGRKYEADEFAKIVVLARPNGEIITLDRIAEIKDAFTEDVIISRFNGRSVVSVIVLKTPDEDSLAIDKAVRAYITRKEAQMPGSHLVAAGMHMNPWGGHVDILRARIRLLVRNGTIGLVLVFIVLWLFLDIRLSFWAGMGMPISVAGALAIMWGIGATINMVSLFGLIMVLGIIVDDAIVVGEAIYVARKNGAPPLRAAVDGVMEVGLPVVAAVTTSIVAFIPLMFVGGIMGKFIKILPVVVIACLAISLVECLILLPAHLNHLPDFKAGRDEGKRNRGFVRRFLQLGRGFHGVMDRRLEWFVARVYGPFLSRALEWRYVSLCVAIAVLLATQGYMQSGRMKFQVMPKIEGNRAKADIEFPNGTPISVTKDAVAHMEASIKRLAARTKTLSGEPLITHMYSTVGSIPSDEGPGEVGSHVGSVRVRLLDYERRGMTSQEALVAWEKEVGQIPGAVSMSYSGGGMGPPGAPIEIWLQGHEMAPILAAAEEVKAKLGTFVGVYQIQDDWRPGKNEIKIRLKPEATALGMSVAGLATQIHAGYFGEQAVRIQRGRDDIRVRVRYPEQERKELDEFKRIRIRTPLGAQVPLLSVADLEYGPGYANIQRTDGMRRVSVTAEVDVAVANANEILSELLEEYLPSLDSAYSGVQVSVQGEKRKMRESFGSLFISYPLALLGIYIIVATIFRSYVQPLVIMVTVPFGIIGAIIGHVLLGYGLSMMSFFGMVALSGVVVNDAIVLIECINSYLGQGMPLFEAIRRGGARRFRAIFLTTVSTVGGLTPLLLEQDRQARFLIPMAVSIAAGVAFATLLTLLLIPCLLCILNDLRRVAHWVINRRWPTREDVEPARMRYAGEHEGAPEGGRHATIPAPSAVARPLTEEG